eukprot:51701-Chlamydomonas_euryale.AAC.2
MQHSTLATPDPCNTRPLQHLVHSTPLCWGRRLDSVQLSIRNRIKTPQLSHALQQPSPFQDRAVVRALNCETSFNTSPPQLHPARAVPSSSSLVTLVR